MPQHAATVFIVDDDVSVRESLEALIRWAGWRTESFGSAEAFLARPRTPEISCLVLDVTLPDLSGLEVQRRLGAAQGQTPIIFITGHGDIPMSVQAMKAGATEFLTKPIDDETLLEAVRQALARSEAAFGVEAELVVLRADHASLSGREREVMGLVVSGLMNKQVGGQLGISEITVKAHRGQVMRKMKAHSLAALVNMDAKLHRPAAS